jgi:hypothetical protein
MATTRTRTPKRKLSFQDRISRLTVRQAVLLLGEEGEKLLRAGGQKFPLDPDKHAYLSGDLFRVRIPDAEMPGGKAVVVLTQLQTKNRELHLRCDQCEVPCLHAGAALDLLLDQKLMFGLSAPPDEDVPLELLTEEELLQRALAERRKRAAEEKMILR